jgi:hypothetical protein
MVTIIGFVIVHDDIISAVHGKMIDKSHVVLMIVINVHDDRQDIILGRPFAAG